VGAGSRHPLVVRAARDSRQRRAQQAHRGPAGHGVGKSYTAAGLAAWWVDTHPDGIVVSTAPTKDQVHAILWEEIRGLHGRLKLPGHTGLNDTWTIGRRLVGFGRKPPDAAAGSDFAPSTFQGIHRTGGVLVIIDEGRRVPGERGSEGPGADASYALVTGSVRFSADLSPLDLT
jgi:hypothetical protein